MGIHVLGGDESNPSLEEEGLRMLAAVGQGARTPPRLVVLEHRGAAEEAGTVALVGKGVTFDTGGLNLKPTGFIEVRVTASRFFFFCFCSSLGLSWAACAYRICTWTWAGRPR